MIHPTRDEFRERARRGNLIPVYETIIADLETPVTALAKIGQSHSVFLLESVERGENLGRYTFLGADPSVIFKSRGDEITLTEHGETRTVALNGGDSGARDPLDVLKSLMARYTPVVDPDLPPFFGGAVGYLGYDMVRFFEPIPVANPDPLELPESLYMITDTILIFDHLHHVLKIVANAHVDGDPDLAYREAVTKIERIVEKLNRPVAQLPHMSAMNLKPGEIPLAKDEIPGADCNFTRDEFMDVVEKCKRYIVAGDVFQVVPSLRRSAPLHAHPLNVYRALRSINPSPYMVYLRHEDLHIAASSPEVLISLTGGQVRLRPIAGTRWRGKSAEEDERLKRDLLADPKERAEHIMLVDLGRNDVGRVSRYHSVRVSELMAVERYSHVMHIVSNVIGQVREDCDAFDVLRAGFPAGTLTGAPKVRAMEIIDEVENVRRGIYGGAMGWIGYGGDLDTCIAIRTIVMTGGRAIVQAGAGIVYDSDPEYEYNECLNKTKGMFKAIQLAEHAHDELLKMVGGGY